MQKLKVEFHTLFVGVFRKYIKNLLLFLVCWQYMKLKVYYILQKYHCKHILPYVISGPRNKWQL